MERTRALIARLATLDPTSVPTADLAQRLGVGRHVPDRRHHTAGRSTSFPDLVTERV